MAVAHLHPGPAAHRSVGRSPAAAVASAGHSSASAGHSSSAAAAYAVAVALLAVLAVAVAALAFTLAVEQLTESGVITLAPSAEPGALDGGQGV